MDLRFAIHQRVKIKELDWHGTVKQIRVSEKGNQYQVRYFWNMEGKEAYFYEDELAEVPA